MNPQRCFILTMWYANKEKVIEKLGVYAGFILTMWYVNFKVTVKSLNINVGFILTMWYVNIFYYSIRISLNSVLY